MKNTVLRIARMIPSIMAQKGYSPTPKTIGIKPMSRKKLKESNSPEVKAAIIRRTMPKKIRKKPTRKIFTNDKWKGSFFSASSL